MIDLPGLTVLDTPGEGLRNPIVAIARGLVDALSRRVRDLEAVDAAKPQNAIHLAVDLARRNVGRERRLGNRIESAPLETREIPHVP